MKDRKNFMEKARLFHFSTSLPITIIQDDRDIYSLPEKNFKEDDREGRTIRDIVDTIKGNTKEGWDIYHLTNEMEESFIVLSKNVQEKVVVGPFLKEKKSVREINSIMRANRISIREKESLGDYYEGLKIMDSMRSFYSGKLLKFIFIEREDYGDEIQVVEAEEFQPEKYFIGDDRDEGQFNHPPYFLEEQLSIKIGKGNVDESIEILREINSLKRAKLSSNEIRSIKNSLIGSITIFTRAAIKGGVEPEKAYKLSDIYIHRVDELQDVYKLIDFEYSILQDFVELVRDDSSKDYSKTVKDAMAYININLTEEFALKDIAEKVFVHPNYLSSIFNKETGMQISEYIMKKKIEEAKYHVRFTDTPIIDISSFYGFCNQSYFTRVFKKHAGMTPKEYRKKI